MRACLHCARRDVWGWTRGAEERGGKGGASPACQLKFEDDLAGLAGAHHVKALLEVLQRVAVSDDGLQALLQAANKHAAHLVPRLVHFATVNALAGGDARGKS